MNVNQTAYWMGKIREHCLANGGFSGRIGGHYRSDATAWAILALSAFKAQEELVLPARQYLAKSQKEDGRVCLLPDYPQTFWPTPLAVLAWHGSPGHHDAQSRALQFLLSISGKHFEKQANSPVGNDTSIKGWPWIEDTFSWVEPTSIVLLALELTGYGEHERAAEARLMLLDRQLESGGWNYGNTTVFGRQLRPMPESAGLALCALAGRVSQNVVNKSLSYLNDQVDRLHTPLSLGWGLLGLSAWEERPDNAEDLVVQSLDRQDVYGPYNTQQLSLLLVALAAKQGLLELIGNSKD